MTDEQREELLDGWEQASAGWARQAERTRDWLAPLSDWMLTRAELAPGARVVELAAGPGDLSLLAAPRVAPTTVLCTDAVEGMVTAARERAEEHGVTNIEFAKLQLEWIDLPAASVDVILCRLGLMLTVDPEAALRECRRVLAPGGRAVFGVWDVPAVNVAFSLPRAAAIELGYLPADVSGGPGPYALSEPGRLAELCEEAGLFDPVVESIPLTERFSDELDWLGAVTDRSPSFGELWREIGGEDRAALRAATRERADEYRQADGTLLIPTQALGAVATA